jgi:hypothetical protein
VRSSGDNLKCRKTEDHVRRGGSRRVIPAYLRELRNLRAAQPERGRFGVCESYGRSARRADNSPFGTDRESGRELVNPYRLYATWRTIIGCTEMGTKKYRGNRGLGIRTVDLAVKQYFANPTRPEKEVLGPRPPATPAYRAARPDQLCRSLLTMLTVLTVSSIVGILRGVVSR